MRRQEFLLQDHSELHALLSRARIANLATVDPDGAPEVRPMNYAVVGDHLYFHTAPGGTVAARAGSLCAVTVVDLAVWIPSSWRHRFMACPATTYYSSLVVRGALTAVDDLDEKAVVLEAFMARYQPEAGHLPLADPRYRGPLEALTVLKVGLEQSSLKFKFGQHVTAQQRQAIYDRLLERQGPGDHQCAAWMRRLGLICPEPGGHV
ncbi:MAG: pyridoxamine 5'-phosphate oxidase family protein [Candidatus Eremiobacteraeota bacterium]|nr:pyridoxamine 5'-phosphate oxidase family protein [Candidatus Eremiobacteraeota bacterium]